MLWPLKLAKYDKFCSAGLGRKNLGPIQGLGRPRAKARPWARLYSTRPLTKPGTNLGPFPGLIGGIQAVMAYFLIRSSWLVVSSCLMPNSKGY